MRRIFALLVFSVSLLPSFAQSDDFGLDFTVGAEKKLRPGLSFALEGEARTQDNTRKIERWTIGGELQMRLFRTPDKKFELKAAAGWKYMWLNNLRELNDKYDENTYVTPDGTTTETYYVGYNDKHAYWRSRHRTSVSLDASYKLNKRWSVSLKETFQFTHFCEASATVDKYRLIDEEDLESGYNQTTETKDYAPKDRSVLRSKLTVQYNIRHCPVNPYVSVDYGCGLNYTARKWKYTAGADINLTANKQHKLDVFYRYQTENDDDDPNGHFIGAGYKFKF